MKSTKFKIGALVRWTPKAVREVIDIATREEDVGNMDDLGWLSVGHIMTNKNIFLVTLIDNTEHPYTVEMYDCTNEYGLSEDFVWGANDDDLELIKFPNNWRGRKHPQALVGWIDIVKNNCTEVYYDFRQN